MEIKLLFLFVELGNFLLGLAPVRLLVQHGSKATLHDGVFVFEALLLFQHLFGGLGTLHGLGLLLIAVPRLQDVGLRVSFGQPALVEQDMSQLRGNALLQLLRLVRS